MAKNKKTAELKAAAQNQQKKKTNTLIAALSLALVAAIIVLSIAIYSNREPDYVPPPFEPNAQIGTPVPDAGAGFTTLAIAEGYEAALCSHPKLSGGALELCLTNPAANTVWLKARILNEKGDIIGESGILKPGEYVNTVSLAAGEYSGALTVKLMGYTPETYHSAGAVSLSVIVATEND